MIRSAVFLNVPNCSSASVMDPGGNLKRESVSMVKMLRGKPPIRMFLESTLAEGLFDVSRRSFLCQTQQLIIALLGHVGTASLWLPTRQRAGLESRVSLSTCQRDSAAAHSANESVCTGVDQLTLAWRDQ